MTRFWHGECKESRVVVVDEVGVGIVAVEDVVDIIVVDYVVVVELGVESDQL